MVLLSLLRRVVPSLAGGTASFLMTSALANSLRIFILPPEFHKRQSQVNALIDFLTCLPLDVIAFVCLQFVALIIVISIFARISSRRLALISVASPIFGCLLFFAWPALADLEDLIDALRIVTAYIGIVMLCSLVSEISSWISQRNRQESKTQTSRSS